MSAVQGSYDPFAAPSSGAGLSELSELTAASLGDRFVARIVDNLAVAGTVVPGAVAIGLADGMSDPTTGTVIAVGGGLTMLASMLILGVMQAVWLATRGQSLGKRVVGIHIVKVDGSRVDFVSAVLLRSWLPGLVMGVANQLCLGWAVFLADVAPVFGAEQRCVHDYIAGTRVVHGLPAHLLD